MKTIFLIFLFVFTIPVFCQTVDIDPEEAQRQSALLKEQIPLENALAEARKSFLNDASDSESPLSLLQGEACPLVFPGESEKCFSSAGVHPAVKAKAQELLRDHLQDPSSILRLWELDRQPEHGESPRENWIFLLSLPTLSDHLFWAIVDRKGVKPSYNYGFN